MNEAFKNTRRTAEMEIFMKKLGCRALLLGAIVFFAGCATQKPVLYPNAQLERAGKSAATRDIDDCMQKAEAYVESESRAGRAAGDAAVGATTGAIIGGAAGAAGGALVGRAATAGAVGAAGGGAAGATRGLLRGLFRKDSPSPLHKNFVNRCLREKGYELIGWQ